VGQQYLPDEALGARYYDPTTNGFEQVVGTRMSAIERTITERG
jgi:putative ATPase